MCKKLLLALLAITLTIVVLAGCSSTKKPAVNLEDDQTQEVEIVLVTPTDTQKDYNQVIAEVNKYLKQKLNCTLKITFQPMYDEKIRALIMSGEPVDLCFTSSWLFDYRQNVVQGTILPMDELLEQYGPDIVKAIDPRALAGAKINGSLYAVPVNNVMARQMAYALNDSIVRKYKFDFARVTKISDLIPLLEQVKRDYGNQYIPIRRSHWNNLQDKYDFLVSSTLPGAVKINANDYKVIDQYEDTEYIAHLKQIRQFYTLGLADNSLGKDSEDFAFDTGTVACQVFEYEPGAVETWQRGKPFHISYIMATTPPIMNNSAVMQAMTALTVNSNHPARAMKVLNLLYSDPYLLNLLVWGIEGVHYKKLTDNHIELLPAREGKHWEMPNADFGNRYLTYIPNDQPANLWDEIKKFNASAKPSPVLGFAFDRESVKNELAALENICQEYKTIKEGRKDPSELPIFVTKMKAAGMDKVLAEMQKQLDDWRSNNKK